MVDSGRFALLWEDLDSQIAVRIRSNSLVWGA